MSWEIIAAYSRAQAIEDGTLVDVTEQAKLRGIKLPTALSAGPWVEVCVAGPRESVPARVDALVAWVAQCICDHVRNGKGSDDRITTTYAFAGREPVDLIIHIGPGDDGEAVLTVMCHEDD